MPELLQPTSIKGAVFLTETELDRNVSQVDGSGKHRLVRWKEKEGKTRVVYSKEPLKDYAGTLGISSYRGKKAVSLEVGKFQESLKTEEITEIVHVTGDGEIYRSTPVEWREFLNSTEFNPVWEISSTEEKVISVPVSKLEKV